MKYWSLFLLLLLIGMWAYASIALIGNKKTNSVKVETTASDFVLPTPTELIAKESSQSSILVTPTPTLDATSSSFVVASPSVSVLQY